MPIRSARSTRKKRCQSELVGAGNRIRYWGVDKRAGGNDPFPRPVDLSVEIMSMLRHHQTPEMIRWKSTEMPALMKLMLSLRIRALTAFPAKPLPRSPIRRFLKNLRGNVDLSLALLDFAVDRGSLAALTHLHLSSNLAFTNLSLHHSRDGFDNVPEMVRDGQPHPIWGLGQPVQTESAKIFWSQMENLRKLELMTAASSSFVLILAARHCPNLAVLRSHLKASKVNFDHQLHERDKGLTEQAVKEAIFSSSTLEELKVVITRGNQNVIMEDMEVWSGFQAKSCRLKSLEITWHMLFWRRSLDPDQV